MRPKLLISSNHPLFHRGLFSFLIPSMPNLNTASIYTQELSRHSSRSTTTSRHVTVPTTKRKSPSLTQRLVRLFKKFGPHQEEARVEQVTHKLPNRYASTSTVHSSWSHVMLSNTKDKKKHSFTNKMKQRRRFSESAASSQVSAPLVALNRRVQLSRRPTLTVGTVMYVGHVNFADGVWIGVELDRRGKKKKYLRE